MFARLRNCAGALRDRIEGAAFVRAAPRADAEPAAARQALLRRRGLRPYRELWWTSSRFEPPMAIWAQALLLEHVEREAPRWVPSSRAGTLVVALGHLGDAMHTLPLLRALRERGPVSVAAGPWASWIFERSGLADAVLVYAPDLLQYRRTAGSDAQGGAALAALRAIGSRGFSTVISTGPTDWASWAVVRAARPLRWVGVAPRPGAFPAAGAEEVRAYEQDVPESQRLLRLADLPDASAELFWPHLDEARAAGRGRLAAAGCDARQPYACLAPGGGWPGKLWPADRFAEVARLLHERHGLPAVVVGSDAEREMGERVRSGSASRWNLCGATALEELIGIIAGARLLVCNDSLALHVAAAAGVPTVSLFGPTRPAQWAPRGPSHRALRGVEGCPRCCPWHPRARCEEPVSCMAKIGAGAVLAAADAVLKEAR